MRFSLTFIYPINWRFRLFNRVSFSIPCARFNIPSSVALHLFIIKNKLLRVIYQWKRSLRCNKEVRVLRSWLKTFITLSKKVRCCFSLLKSLEKIEIVQNLRRFRSRLCKFGKLFKACPKFCNPMPSTPGQLEIRYLFRHRTNYSVKFNWMFSKQVNFFNFWPRFSIFLFVSRQLIIFRISISGVKITGGFPEKYFASDLWLWSLGLSSQILSQYHNIYHNLSLLTSFRISTHKTWGSIFSEK